MKAQVVFVHQQQWVATLQVGSDDYYVVQSKSHAAMARADEISGDLALRDVKWLLNITRSKLIDIKVLGRYGTLRSAIAAMTERPQRGAWAASCDRTDARGGQSHSGPDPSALNHAQQDHDARDRQEDVDKPAHGVRRG
jgi:hypothetical protein